MALGLAPHGIRVNAVAPASPTPRSRTTATAGQGSGDGASGAAGSHRPARRTWRRWPCSWRQPMPVTSPGKRSRERRGVSRVMATRFPHMFSPVGIGPSSYGPGRRARPRDELRRRRACRASRHVHYKPRRRRGSSSSSSSSRPVRVRPSSVARPRAVNHCEPRFIPFQQVIHACTRTTQSSSGRNRRGRTPARGRLFCRTRSSSTSPSRGRQVGRPARVNKALSPGGSRARPDGASPSRGEAEQPLRVQLRSRPPAPATLSPHLSNVRRQRLTATGSRTSYRSPSRVLQASREAVPAQTLPCSPDRRRSVVGPGLSLADIQRIVPRSRGHRRPWTSSTSSPLGLPHSFSLATRMRRHPLPGRTPSAILPAGIKAHRPALPEGRSPASTISGSLRSFWPQDKADLVGISGRRHVADPFLRTKGAAEHLERDQPVHRVPTGARRE